MKFLPLMAGVLLLAVAAVGGTSTSSWATPGGTYYIPPCGTTHSTDGNTVHFEVEVGIFDSAGQVAAYDAFKAAGYHNLGLRAMTATAGVFYGDCSFGS